MTKIEIKNEIQKVLENVPENILQDILHLLKGLQNQPNDKLEITHSLRQILVEDKELLEKLDLKTVESVYNILIDKFGGSKGIRDIRSLEAALARPYSTFN